MSELIILAVLGILACVIHSLTAAVVFKEWVRGVVGDRLYDRYYPFTYSAASFIYFGLPVWYGLTKAPDNILRNVQFRIPLYIIQLAGFAIVLWWILIDFRVLRLWGVKQVFEGTSKPKQQLITSGTYRFSRHPLYAGIMLIMLAQPVMHVNIFVLFLIATIYFYMGSFLEEQKLINEFGEQYLSYQLQVSRFFPCKNFSRNLSSLFKNK